jgi:hypothetical protein
MWSIDGMMLAAKNGNIQRKTFHCSSFPPQKPVDNCLSHDTKL